MIFNDFRDQKEIKSVCSILASKSVQQPATIVVTPKIALKRGKTVVKRTHFIFPPTFGGRWPTPALRGVGLEKNVALNKGTIHNSLKITKRTHFLRLNLKIKYWFPVSTGMTDSWIASGVRSPSGVGTFFGRRGRLPFTVFVGQISRYALGISRNLTSYDYIVRGRCPHRPRNNSYENSISLSPSATGGRHP